MKPEHYSEADVIAQFNDALRRSDTWPGPRVGIGTIIRYANEGGYRMPVSNDNKTAEEASRPFDLDAAAPRYFSSGMPRREFAGPPIGDALLFPLNALSLFVALGGVGKTTTMIAMAAHIAAGKAWGIDELTPRRVLIFCIEESQEELNRKYGAAVHSWTDYERKRAEENLRLISCLDRDARLTMATGRQVDVTGVNQQIISAALEFGAEVVVLDHLQGFASGDLNNSDTATALARASNVIVAQTGAAVIQTAHIAKHNINAQEVFDGFTTGSLAFENAARQVTGVIPLPDEDAKNFDLDKAECLMMGMPKNSYGPCRQRGYLRKAHVLDFHTITVVPLTPTIRARIRSASDRLKDDLVDYVKGNPGATPNKLDGLAGKGGRFKATKEQVRVAMKELEAEGRVILKELSKEDRKARSLPQQTRRVYEHVV